MSGAKGTGSSIAIIVPCFNEERNVVLLYNRLSDILGESENYTIIFVDDGSKDHTLRNIKLLAETDARVKYISLSRNFGHQNALKAGMDMAAGDCVITMDGDLQHPPELIPEMLLLWRAGNRIVYTTRTDGRGRWGGKGLTSGFFYKLFNQLSDVKLDRGAADFRLLDASVVKIISGLREQNPFLRGLVSWAGFKQAKIPYVPAKRASGRTKYTLGRMIDFAFSGFLSFGVSPLRLAFILGLVCSLLSFAYGMYSLYIHFFTDDAVAGWPSVIASVLFLSGIQLIMTGVVGEYVGKIFLEVKQRPAYIIADTNLQIYVPQPNHSDL